MNNELKKKKVSVRPELVGLKPVREVSKKYRAKVQRNRNMKKGKISMRPVKLAW